MNSFARWISCCLFLITLFLLMLPPGAHAQQATGRIIGVVTDPQGGTIPSAAVTIANVEISRTWSTVTSSDGSYQVLDLPIGSYTVTVSATGFAKAVTSAQSLNINQSLRVDVHLKLGAISEQIQVQSEASQVETINPTVGGTVTGAPVQDLPLNGRDTLQLALTQPGVTPSSAGPFEAEGVPQGAFNIAGGRDNSVTYLLDGGNNTSVTYGVPVMNPNPDTVAEFRILENNYTAEYGRSAGGVISVVTKSGTNHLHGSIFDYLRNDAFNANTYFNNEAGLARPVLKRNQFGGTLGGPITLPHLVNGADRFFFFAGYQGQRENSVTVGNGVTVFTPAELNGNFSQSSNGAPDPNVVAFLETHPYFQSNPTLAAQGVIDPSKFDPVAQKYINAGLIPTSSSGFLVPNGTAKDNRDEFSGKFDFNASRNDRISLTLTKFHNVLDFPFLPAGLTPNVPGFPGTSKFDNYFGNVAYLRTFSANTINEFHLTAQRANNSLDFPARNLPGPSSLGVAVMPDQTTGPPQIQLAASGVNLGFNGNGPADYADNTYEFSDTFTRVHGKHTLKMGGQLTIVQFNAFFAFVTNGAFIFSGPSGIGSGNDRADFLLGLPDQFYQYPKGYNGIRSHQYAGFLQDEWKITPRLVLTLGARYEYASPKKDPNGRQYMIIPGLQSRRYPNAPLGLVFPGDPGAPNGQNFPDKNDWAPRFGFAWDPFGNGRTSIRGGAGVFYDVLLGQDNQNQNGTPPFYSAAYIGCLNDTCAPVSTNGPYSYLADPYGSSGTTNPFPSSTLPAPQQLNFVTQGFIPIGPSSIFMDPHLRTPYIYQYSLSVQHQLSNSMSAELGYVGNSSHKLTTLADADPIILGTTTRILNTQPGLQIPDAFAQMAGTTINGSTASYNALVSSFTKRMGDWHSLGETFFTVSYTLAHNLDDADGIQRNSSQVPAYNQHQFRASADADIRHRFVLSGGWTLPFDHLWSTGPKRLTSGWSLYPIISAQSGMPMDVNAGLFVDGTPGPSGAGDQNLVRPNWPGGRPQSEDPHKLQTFIVGGTPISGHFIFNPTGLSEPDCYSSASIPGMPGGCPAFTYGTLSRNFFRGPDRVNFDIALEKQVDIVRERVKMVFRAEYFNVLNHTEWQNPPGGAASFFSPQLGQVTSTFDPRIGQLALRIVF